MSLKHFVGTLAGISVIPIIIKHFDIEIKNKEELFESIDYIKKGTKGIVKFSYHQIKDILEDNNKIISYIIIIMSNICKYYYKKKLTDKQRDSKKMNALKKLGKKIDINKLNKKAIKNTFEILDDIYFDNQISERLDEIDAKISFDVSNRLSCTAGYCEYFWKTDYYGNKRWKFKLVISTKIINNLFSNKETSLKINGLKCSNKLECYLNLYQHRIFQLP